MYDALGEALDNIVRKHTTVHEYGAKTGDESTQFGALQHHLSILELSDNPPIRFHVFYTVVYIVNVHQETRIIHHRYEPEGDWTKGQQLIFEGLLRIHEHTQTSRYHNADYQEVAHKCRKIGTDLLDDWDIDGSRPYINRLENPTYYLDTVLIVFVNQVHGCGDTGTIREIILHDFLTKVVNLLRLFLLCRTRSSNGQRVRRHWTAHDTTDGPYNVLSLW